MNATTHLVTENVTAKKVMDWVISSQAPLKEGEGSTTRKISLNPMAWRNSHECGVEIREKGDIISTLFLIGDGLNMPRFAKKFFVDREELAQSYNELGSMNKVADKFGVSKKLVLNYMNRFGINRNQPCTSNERAEQVAELAKRGMDSKNIAKTLGVSQSAIRKIAQQFAITVEDKFHKGFTISNGYRLIYAPEHHDANSKGYAREHRMVVEQDLGRQLNDDEVVHHKDGNKSNNSLDNLEVMTVKQHKTHHASNAPLQAWEGRRKQAETLRISKDIVSSAIERCRGLG